MSKTLQSTGLPSRVQLSWRRIPASQAFSQRAFGGHLVTFPIIPLVISTALGAGDGVLAGADAKAGRVTITKQRTLWLQGGAFLLGVVGEFMRWHPDLTEP